MPDERGVPIPDDIIGLSRSDVVVCAVLHLWKSGAVTWEQAMMVAVTNLSAEVARLRKQTLSALLRTPAFAIIPDPAKGVDPEIERLRTIVAARVCGCGAGKYSHDPKDHTDQCEVRRILG